MGDHTDASLSASRPPPLVGRVREQNMLRERLSGAINGHGSLILISGEAGIGKSTLASALASEASQRGALVAIGSAHEQAETPPYGPWVELISQSATLRSHGLLPTSIMQPETSEESAGQSALITQLRDFFLTVATERPLVLMLEDIHWADVASLDLLRLLGRQLGRSQSLLVATYRDDEVMQDNPLFELIPVLVRESPAVRVELHPLDRAAMREMLRAQYRLRPADEHRLTAYLDEHSEGHPLFAAEMLRAFGEAGVLREPDSSVDFWSLGDLAGSRLPTLLRQVINLRLNRLGEDSRYLLETASVVGHEIVLSLWSRIAATSESALLELIDKAMQTRIMEMAPRGTRVRFAHALIRDVLYAELAPSRKRRLHQQIAEALATVANPDPDSIAHHFRQAGDPRGIEWLIRASERAQRLYAWQTAAERLEAALELMEDVERDTPEKGWLCYRAARLRRYSNPERGIAGLVEAERLARATGDPVLAAFAQCDRGTLHCFGIDLRRGLEELETGLAALDDLTNSRHPMLSDPLVALWVADSLPTYSAAGSEPVYDALAPAQSRKGALTIWLGWAGRFEEALALGERLTEGIDTKGKSPARWVALGDAFFGLGMAYGGLGMPEQARQAFKSAREFFSKSEHYIGVAHTGLVELLWFVVPYRADHVTERRQIASEAVAAWARASQAATGPFGADLPVLLLEGKWDEAFSLAVDVRTANRDRPVIELVTLAAAKGNRNLVAQLTRDALPDGSASDPGSCPFPTGLVLLRANALIAVDERDFESARYWLEAHDRWLARSRAVFGRVEGQLAWAQCYFAAGDLRSARNQAERALVQASEVLQPLALIASHRLLGEIAATVGESVIAAEHLDKSLALADRCEVPYERALTLLALAELRGSTGDKRTALAHLEDAHAILTRLDASPALERANALASRFAVETAQEIRLGGQFGLTPREMEVLHLLSQRWSDKEIAEALFISPRTVTSHVTAILGKLDAKSRREASMVAARAGLVDSDRDLQST